MTIAAVRTVSETDDIHIIEGLGIPFGGPFAGRDSYRTFASVRTDFAWDLFPDSMEDPKFIRPVTYQHGFDDTIGLRRIGGWSPIRTDDSGVWVRAQLDKRDKYYSEYVRPLLEANGLGLSSGSVEHSVRIDAKTGEWQTWPAWDLALTPTESNPLAVIAARSVNIDMDRADAVRIIDTRADLTTKSIDDLPDTAFAYIEPGGKKDDEGKTTPRAKRHFPVHDKAHAANALARLPDSPFEKEARPAVEAAAKKFGIGAERSAVRGDWGGPASDAATGAGIVAQIYALADGESSEPMQYAQLIQAANLVQEWMNAEVAEPPDDDAVRAGKRNSMTDQQHLDAAHVAAHVAMTHTLTAGATCDTCTPPADNPQDGEEDDAARSGEALPTIHIVERSDLDAVRVALLSRAETVGAETVRRLLG